MVARSAKPSLLSHFTMALLACNNNHTSLSTKTIHILRAGAPSFNDTEVCCSS